MDKVTEKLIVFFEQPFWVGVFEKIAEGKISICKVTFGAEPKDNEVYDFIIRKYYQLRFSSAVTTDLKTEKHNPKRMQRDIKKQLQENGIGTKSQQALKLQYEQIKTEHKQFSKEQKEAKKQRLFELKQQKRKEKHRGR